ncbi:hypothetical protein D9M69_443060 [compost metagenome]
MSLLNSILGRLTPGLQTLDTWCETYDTIISARPLKLKTLQNKRSNAAHLRHALGHRSMRSICPADIAMAVRAIWASGRPVAARRVLIEAQDLFNEAVLARVINQNPAAHIRQLPAPVKRSRLTFERWSEIHRWATENGQPWFAYALRLALVSAQRRADIITMRQTHVWNEHLHVIQQKTGMRIALPLALHCNALGVTLGEIIREADDYRRPGDLLLRKAGDQQFGAAALTASFIEARDAVFPRETWGDRTPPTFHEIRSLSERLYRAQGVDTQTLLGHKHQSMTDLYNDDRGLSRNDWKTLVM